MEVKCNHDLDINTTLIKSHRKVLVHPEQIDYFCPICKRCFRYIKDSEGNLSLVKE